MQERNSASPRKTAWSLSTGPRKIVRERSTVFVNVVPRNATGPWMTTMSPSIRCSTMSGLSWVSRMPSTTESRMEKRPRITRTSVTRDCERSARTESGSVTEATGTAGIWVSRRSPETTAFLMDTPLPAFNACRTSAAWTACAARSGLEQSGLKWRTNSPGSPAISRSTWQDAHATEPGSKSSTPRTTGSPRIIWSVR